MTANEREILSRRADGGPGEPQTDRDLTNADRRSGPGTVPMGFRVLLIAVEGKEPEQVQREYGGTPADRFREVPEARVSGVLLPKGRYLLYVNDRIVPEDRVLARLSRGASLLACYANETVMNSLATEWKDGTERWSVFHDAQQGLRHLEARGELPAEFEPIRRRLVAEQEEDEEVDYLFDIPIELFVARGGIRYDEDPEGAGPQPWQVLERRWGPPWLPGWELCEHPSGGSFTAS